MCANSNQLVTHFASLTSQVLSVLNRPSCCSINLILVSKRWGRGPKHTRNPKKLSPLFGMHSQAIGEERYFFFVMPNHYRILIYADIIIIILFSYQGVKNNMACDLVQPRKWSIWFRSPRKKNLHNALLNSMAVVLGNKGKRYTNCTGTFRQGEPPGSRLS